MSRPPPSPQKQLIFIVVFGLVVAALSYVGTFFFPREAKPLFYLEGWAFLVAIVFWAVERAVRGAIDGKKKV